MDVTFDWRERTGTYPLVGAPGNLSVRRKASAPNHVWVALTTVMTADRLQQVMGQVLGQEVLAEWMADVDPMMITDGLDFGVAPNPDGEGYRVFFRTDVPALADRSDFTEMGSWGPVRAALQEDGSWKVWVSIRTSPLSAWVAYIPVIEEDALE